MKLIQWIAAWMRPRPVSAPAYPTGRVRAKYDAAVPGGDDRRHWQNADPLAADAANSPEVRKRLRERARYEAANNPYCGGTLRTLAADVVGSGPGLQIQAENDDDAKVAEDRFYRWAKAVRLAKKLRLMRLLRARDGEVFAVLFTNSKLRGTPVKLDLRVYEADQFAAPRPDPNDLADGIKFDDLGNVESYTLLKYHPGDPRGGSPQGITIPARFVLHWFREDRAGQSRGVSEITASLVIYSQYRRYAKATLSAAETSANISGVIETQTSPEDPDELEPLDPVDMDRNIFMTMPKGWKASAFKPEQPTTTYAEFKRAVLSEAARDLGMPYNVAAIDSSQHNFASGRLDDKVYERSIHVDRTEGEESLLDPLFAVWWEEASKITGFIPDSIVNPPPEEFIEPGEIYIPPHSWMWDGREFLDPQKEAAGKREMLSAGLTTYADELAKQGKDWREHFRQMSVEKEAAAALGITILPQAMTAPAAPGQQPQGGGSNDDGEPDPGDGTAKPAAADAGGNQREQPAAE